MFNRLFNLNRKENVTMTFSTSKLTGGRVLVQGTDRNGVDGQEVLDSETWDYAQAAQAHSKAHESFDQTVEDFFKPLTEAADKLKASLQMPELDTDSYVVITEEVEGQAPVAQEVIKLDRDGVILRLLAQQQDDRLVWVNGSLEVLAPQAPAPAQP